MKSILTTLLILCVEVFSISAQSDQVHVKRKDLKKEFIQSLSEDQKEQLDLQKNLKRNIRKQ